MLPAVDGGLNASASVSSVNASDINNYKTITQYYITIRAVIVYNNNNTM